MTSGPLFWILFLMFLCLPLSFKGSLQQGMGFVVCPFPPPDLGESSPPQSLSGWHFRECSVVVEWTQLLVLGCARLWGFAILPPPQELRA